LGKAERGSFLNFKTMGFSIGIKALKPKVVPGVAVFIPNVTKPYYELHSVSLGSSTGSGSAAVSTFLAWMTIMAMSSLSLYCHIPWGKISYVQRRTNF
jgi:hypothetical protein